LAFNVFLYFFHNLQYCVFIVSMIIQSRFVLFFSMRMYIEPWTF